MSFCANNHRSYGINDLLPTPLYVQVLHINLYVTAEQGSYRDGFANQMGQMHVVSIIIAEPTLWRVHTCTSLPFPDTKHDLSTTLDLYRERSHSQVQQN